MSHRIAVLLFLPLLGCVPTESPLAVPPESDAGVELEPERDIVLHVGGLPTTVTSLPGAEELEVVSPDGAWVGFVSDTTGWASVWAAPMPRDGVPGTPVQLTNVGIERLPRTPGVAPKGFVPVPETARGLQWADDRTLTWTASGTVWTAQVPR